MLPDRIGRYRILALLGRGGMGVLYRALDPVLNRDVAIKVLPSERLGDAQARDRFFREARAAAGLQHANIVTVHEFVEGDSPYLVLELLQGQDLEVRLREGDPLTFPEQLDIVCQLCDGLACAHAAGIVHRDVKPSNIWIQPDGRVKLLDFGVAKFGMGVTSTGEAVGSTPFMAPEQFRNEPIDGRADLFAVGVVLYRLASGVHPFRGDSPGAVMLSILSSDPTPLEAVAPHAPSELAVIVRRALRKELDERYQSVTALAADLRALRARLIDETVGDTAPADDALYVEPLPVLLPRLPSITAVPSRWIRTRARVLATATVLVMVVIGALAWTRTGARPNVGSSDTGPATTVRPVPPAPKASPVLRAVRITSEPAGATVVIDGQPTGRLTPAVFDLRVLDSHVVSLRKPGFATVEHRIDAAALDAGEISATLAPAPTWVNLAIRGSYPFEVIDGSRVISGAATEHSVSVLAPRVLWLRAPSYFLNQSIRLDPASPRRELIVPKLGRLTVRARETCQVSLAGRVLGYPPINRQPIAAGTYTMELACPGTQRRVVTIAPGADHREVIP